MALSRMVMLLFFANRVAFRNGDSLLVYRGCANGGDGGFMTTEVVKLAVLCQSSC